jgi:hypothetical protein
LTGIIPVAYYLLAVASVAFVQTKQQSLASRSASMDYDFRKILSVVLVLCVLAVGGLAQAQFAEHAGHHEQHQAATHGTLLCSWVCAAGTVVGTDVVLIQAERNSVALLPIPQSSDVCSEPSRISSSRAPPSFLL